MDDETQVALTKISIATGGSLTYGVTLNEWVAIITIVYIVLQIGLLIPKYIKMLYEFWKNRSFWRRRER